MMFKRLGILGVFAVCLFALVMGGCNREDPPPEKPIEIVTPPVETLPEETKEKTFKEQLVAGQWRAVELDVKNGLRRDPDLAAKDWADTFTRKFGVPYTGRVSRNSLRFEDSGKVVIILGFAFIADPALPELGLIVTLKGSYQIAVDLGSSATVTLSITEIVWDVKPDAADARLEQLEFNINDELGGVPGEVIGNGRGSIDGGQLRLGSRIIAERVN